MAQPADSGTSRNLLTTEHQLPRSCTAISGCIDCADRTCYVESGRGNSMSVYARCLCLVAVVSVRSRVSQFLPRPVSVPRVSHDALFLHLKFSRRVLFLYVAFPAKFGPCISRFSCSVLASGVSLFSPFPVMVTTLYPRICTLSASKHCQTSCNGVCNVSFQAWSRLASVSHVPGGRPPVRLKLTELTFQTCPGHV